MIRALLVFALLLVAGCGKHKKPARVFDGATEIGLADSLPKPMVSDTVKMITVATMSRGSSLVTGWRPVAARDSGYLIIDGLYVTYGRDGILRVIR